MRETELGSVYELKDIDGEYRQKIHFAKGMRDGTTILEVLDVLIEKMYSDQSENFSCESSTALEFMKSCRRILIKQKIKKLKNDQRENYLYKMSGAKPY